jgi:hypothetical protein
MQDLGQIRFVNSFGVSPKTCCRKPIEESKKVIIIEEGWLKKRGRGVVVSWCRTARRSVKWDDGAEILSRGESRPLDRRQTRRRESGLLGRLSDHAGRLGVSGSQPMKGQQIISVQNSRMRGS